MRLTHKTLLSHMKTDLEMNLNRLQDAQRQATTGKLFQKASDDPVRMARSIDFRRRLSQTEQYISNTDQALNQTNMLSATLSELTQVVQSAKSEAILSGTETASQEARLASATVVSDLRTRMLNLANTQYQGEYIFAGHKTNTQPFDTNAVYSGDTGQISRTIGLGETLVVNVNGQELFKTGNDIFQTFDNLVADLQNNDTAGIASRIDQLESALQQVLKHQGTVGSRAQQIEAANTRLNDSLINLKEFMSKNEDIDIVEAVINLQSRQNVYEASLQAAPALFQQSLLDFIR